MVGDPGVGKTAIAEGLARNIVEGNVPEYLKDYVICGQVGKYFIDEIIKVAGKENVLVYNIIRNPSIAHSIHQRSKGRACNLNYFPLLASFKD